jgi:uncharacterized protein
MALFVFVEWLFRWLIETEEFSFEWDAGNLTKSVKKHTILPDEVEKVFQLHTALPLGVQIRPIVEEERLGVVGKTGEGRYIMVAFTLREDRVRPISARPASKKERNQYEALLRKIT